MTKIWAAAVGASLLLPTLTPAYAASYGNVNGDGSLDVRDVRMMLQIAGGLAPVGNPAVRLGDVAPLTDYENGYFGDGKITMGDAVRLMRRLNGKEPAEWPAKSNYYQLQAGNTFTVNTLDDDGNVNGQVTNTVMAAVDETQGGVTYVVTPVSDGGDNEQRLVTGKRVNGAVVPFTDSQGRRALGATQFTFNDSMAAFDPPLVTLVYPVQQGTQWSGSTKTKIAGLSVTINYTGVISGPETVTVSAGQFSDVYKVTLEYSGGLPPLASVTGKEYYWFAPYVGPIQHGFTRTTKTLSGTQTVARNPDLKLSAANIHGLRYP